MRRIFIPTDLSEHAERAMEFAFREYGDTADVEFLVVHFFLTQKEMNFLISIDDLIRKNYEKAAVEQVQRVLQRLSNPLFQIKVIVRAGSLKQELLKLATELSANLILFSDAIQDPHRISPSLIKRSPIPMMQVPT